MTERPAGLDDLLNHVTANLPSEPASIALTALAETMLDDPPANEQEAHAAARIVLAQHSRELASMLDRAVAEHRTKYPDAYEAEAMRKGMLAASARLSVYAGRLDGTGLERTAP